MLAQRIRDALEILGSDATVSGGSIREQASAYFGEPVEDRVMSYLSSTARVINDDIIEKAQDLGYSEDNCHAAARMSILIAGIAVGKRLGIEDGEALAHAVVDPDLEDPE